MRFRPRRSRRVFRILEYLPQLPGLIVPRLVPRDLQESIQVGERGLPVPQGAPDRCPIEVGSGQMGIEGDAVVEVLQSTHVITGAIAYGAAVEVGRKRSGSISRARSRSASASRRRLSALCVSAMRIRVSGSSLAWGS